MERKGGEEAVEQSKAREKQHRLNQEDSEREGVRIAGSYGGSISAFSFRP